METRRIILRAFSLFPVIVLLHILFFHSNAGSSVVQGRAVPDPDPGYYHEESGNTSRTVSVRKAPYLIYPGKNNEMQVLWQMEGTRVCYILWGTDSLSIMGGSRTFEYGYNNQHSYTITNLKPGKKYYYSVYTGNEIYKGSFRTAPPDDAIKVKFLAYGDTRTYPADHDSVAAGIVATYKADPAFQSFILSVGDLVDNGNSELHWDSQFFDPAYTNIQEMLSSLPYQSAMGNHEGSGVLFEKYFPYPFVDGRYWSFDYGPAHFVVVDQYPLDDAQLEWIEEDLAATTKPWKFIYFHEPGWSAGGHGNDQDVQEFIQPLCEEYGVSIVFAGHNHYYARAVVNDIQHITTGGGGAPLYDPDPGFPNIVYTEKTYHFCTVEIFEDTLRYTAIRPDGSVIEEIMIYNSAPVGTER
jgi:hypothetical protein